MFLQSCVKRLKRFLMVILIDLLLLIWWKGGEIMAVVYATLIIKGKKTFAQVPDRLKEQVKEILIALECPELAE